MKRLLPVLVAVLLPVLFLLGCARGTKSLATKNTRVTLPRRISIAGMVMDSEGLPVAGTPVRILGSPNPVSLDPRLDQEQIRILSVGQSAADGAYRVEFRTAATYRYYYLSFYVPGAFDEVRYARPNRIDITGRMTKENALLYDFRLAPHGSWQKVQETLKAYEQDSAKARIIRHYGIAEEIRKKPGATDIEIWWYYARGKKFSFRGDTLLDEGSFKPVLK